MKRVIFIIGILLCGGNPLHASVQDAFVKANKLYEAGQYNEAIASYDAIIDKGYTSVSLYYNLGNAYFRTDNIGEAILNYERALRLDPSDKEIKENLALANSKINDKINKVPELFFVKWFNSVLNWFSVSQWGILCIIFMFLTCMLAALFFLSHSYKLKKTGFYVGIMMLIFVIASFINASVLHHRLTHIQQAIVVAPMVLVKSSPDDNGTDKFVIHEGTKVIIEDNVNNWSKIKLGDGNTGWVENLSVSVI